METVKYCFLGVFSYTAFFTVYVWIESYSVIKSTQFNKKGENVLALVQKACPILAKFFAQDVIMVFPTYKPNLMRF